MWSGLKKRALSITSGGWRCSSTGNVGSFVCEEGGVDPNCAVCGVDAVFSLFKLHRSLSRKSEKKAIVKKSSVSYVNENLCYRRLEAINKFDRRRMIVSGGSVKDDRR